MGSVGEGGATTVGRWSTRRSIAKVPEEMVLQSNLVGDKEAIRERLSAYKTAGVSTLRVQPAGKDLNARLETLGGTLDLIRELD